MDGDATSADGLPPSNIKKAVKICALLIFVFLAILSFRLDYVATFNQPFYSKPSESIVKKLSKSQTANSRYEGIGEQNMKSLAPSKPPWLSSNDIRSSLNKAYPKGKIQLLASEYVEMNNDFSVKPGDIKFLPHARSPCWVNNSRMIDCLPRFYIAGFSKCGTTDLWHRLMQHRQMYRQYEAKEPMWWAQRRVLSAQAELNQHATVQKQLIPGQWFKISMKTYLNNFNRDQEPQHKVIVDGSSGLLSVVTPLADVKRSIWRQKPSHELVTALQNHQITAIHLISQYTPNAKYITMLRDPADRLYSAYSYAFYVVKSLLGTKGTQKDFHERVIKAIESFKICFGQTGDSRYCSYASKVLVTDSPPVLTLQKGLYAVFISDLLRYVPRENAMFIHLQDYKTNRVRTIRDIMKFLKIDKDPIFDKQIENEDPNSVHNSIKSMGMDIGPMWKETRMMLNEFYRPFNEELARLLGDDKYLFNQT